MCIGLHLGQSNSQCIGSNCALESYTSSIDFSKNSTAGETFQDFVFKGRKMEERACLWTYPAQFHCAQGTESETRVQCPWYPRGKRRCLARACGMDRGSRLSFRSRAKPRSTAKNRRTQPPEEQPEADTSTPSSTLLRQTSERDEDLENTSPKSSKTERKVQQHESAERTRSLCMCAAIRQHCQQIHGQAGW